MALGAMMLASCLNDDTDFSGIIEGDGDYVPKTIAFDATPLQETEGTIPSDDNDYVENSRFRYHVNVHYAGDQVTFSGDVARVQATARGGHVTVNSAVSGVEYILSGESTDGSFKLYSENKMKRDLGRPPACQSRRCGHQQPVRQVHVRGAGCRYGECPC